MQNAAVPLSHLKKMAPTDIEFNNLTYTIPYSGKGTAVIPILQVYRIIRGRNPFTGGSGPLLLIEEAPTVPVDSRLHFDEICCNRCVVDLFLDYIFMIQFLPASKRLTR